MNGRKRTILVDTNGWVLRVVVVPANTSDQEAARQLLDRPDELLGHLKQIKADQGFQGGELEAWTEKALGAKLVVTGRTTVGFWLAPGEEPPEAAQESDAGRWVVERALAWSGRCRRLAKDYEYLPESEEAFYYLAAAHLLLKRLTR